MRQRFHAEIPLFLDINECERDEDECNVNANCSNTVGSYDCTCISGFEGSGFNEDCISKFNYSYSESHTYLGFHPYLFFHSLKCY